MVASEMSALIVAKPGRMRDGLYTLLRTIPDLTTINVADDSRSALNILSTHHPALILLGSNLKDHDVRTLLERTRNVSFGAQSIVLVNNRREQALARANGADSVLLTGFSAQKFFSTVDQLLAVSDIREASRPSI